MNEPNPKLSQKLRELLFNLPKIEQDVRELFDCEELFEEIELSSAVSMVSGSVAFEDEVENASSGAAATLG